MKKLKPGFIFIPKDRSLGDYFAVVAQGLDCAFYRGDWNDVLASEMLFRVIVSIPDFLRHWDYCGSIHLPSNLSEFAWYGDKQIGSSEHYIMQMMPANGRELIDQSEFSRFEPMLVWSSENIFDRIKNNRGKFEYFLR